jgi:two-component system, NarL family, response regulator NreC
MNWQVLANTILIVDDSAAVRQSLHRLLESDYEWTVCGEAVNGRDGIEQARRLKPDVVLMDMSMPEMDGIAAAKTLKILMPTLPIIMFSNFAGDEFLKQELLSAGIGQVVSKSDSQALIQAIQNCFFRGGDAAN